MGTRPNESSVTARRCTCGFLEQQADDPRVPIVFDEPTSENHFTYTEAGCAGPSTLILYHCPFCGGAAPPSKRVLPFAVIPPAEEERLSKLLRPVTSVRFAIERLGRPDS